jgi:3D (Asp-Asp-Asp) domain-containing protein
MADQEKMEAKHPAPVEEDETIKYKVINTGYYRATAYNSEVAQTDSTPCIAASGFNLCENNEENVVAVNFLPLGTKIRIPEYYGDRVFTVEDRMATRFGNTVDIWFKDRQTALQFGVKKSVKIEVVEEINPTDKELALNK